MKRIKILIADDHNLIRDAIKLHLKGDAYEVVAEADNGNQTLDLLAKMEVDIVFMDINMPGIDGITATQQISKKYPNTEVIALTMLQEPHYIRQMFEAGAKGYLLKNCGGEDLRASIAQVMAGEIYYSPEVSDSVIKDFLQDKPKSSGNVFELKLTNREKEVLSLIAQEYSNREIAEKLFISIRTVDAHRRNLLEKTGSKNTAGLTLVALKMGLLDPR